MVRFHSLLTDFREGLNGLNVYPIPDGDTGTNLARTLGSVVVGIGDANNAAKMAEVAETIAYSSLMGARGNSGVIMSQILRALADTFLPESQIGPAEMADGLDRATAAAYRAVGKPVEGTILTVLREAAEVAKAAAGNGDDLETLLGHAYHQAVDTLGRTPELLAVLKQAGVVDAGGAGLVLLLASFLEVASGVAPELPERLLLARADLAGLASVERPPDLRYEVMFMLSADDDQIDGFRSDWDSVGDSIVVVGGGGIWNCHIHTDRIGSAIEAGIAAGTPSAIRVTDLTEAEHTSVVATGFEPIEAASHAPVGVVAVVAGSGLVEVFRQLGAQAVVSGGQTMNPSTKELLAAIDSIPAASVIVLPNNKNIVPVAEQLDRLSTKPVRVVPTRSIPQGIAAMFGYNTDLGDAEEISEDMAAAASSVVDGEITRAVRDATVDYGSISRGDWLGIADGTIVVVGPDLEAALRGLVAAILPDGAELLTIYPGEGAQPSAAKALQAWLAELHPRLSVCEVAGGQPLYPYLVSIE